MTDSPTCAYCGKTPSELDEYTDPEIIDGLTPDEYVRQEEGTYNRESNRFACTICYVKIGMPSSPRGWKAP